MAEPNWLVRAGVASAQSLMAGYRPHIGAPGLVGCSVQYAPGHTVDELAQAGQFKNLQISYATEDVLQAALSSLGYRLQLARSPGKGFHHTLVILYDTGGAMLQRLPLDAAEALSRSFQRRTNPYPIP